MSQNEIETTLKSLSKRINELLVIGNNITEIMQLYEKERQLLALLD
jgi:hypothetical protein